MLPDLFSPPFNYGLVDGLGRSWQRNIAPKIDGMTFRASNVGPVIEICNLAFGLELAGLRSSPWFDEGRLTAVLNAVGAARPYWLDFEGRYGLVKSEALRDEKHLSSFKIDAHKAALATGFRKAAPLLVAAMGELIGNVLDHSEAQSTGIAIFAAQDGAFEFIVADSGIGPLKSLKKNARYADMQEHSAALQAMIETGVSRFGDGTGHGNGFRPIFEKLADMTGQLRFRSGDYALSLEGKFGDRIKRQLAQKPLLRGFFAAVTCHPPRWLS